MAKGSNPSSHTKSGMPCFYPEGDPTDWCQRHMAEARVSLGSGTPKRLSA